jgi:hypothetical protein
MKTTDNVEWREAGGGGGDGAGRPAGVYNE